MGAARKFPRWVDAHHRKEITELKNWLRWLKTHNVKGFIGEFGFPVNSPSNSFGDADRWEALADHYLREIRKSEADVWATLWCASELQVVSGHAKYAAYSPPGDGTTKTLSTIREPDTSLRKFGSARQKNRYIGVNIAIGESKFYHQPLGSNTGQYHNQNVGVFDTDYWYPKAGSYQMLSQRPNFYAPTNEQPIQLVRVPFRWERLQRTLGGALDATEVGHLRTSLTAANDNGIKTVPTLMNFSRYFLYDSVLAAGKERVIETSYTDVEGGTATPITVAHWVDFWRKFVAEFKNDASIIGYGIMNEPDPVHFRTTWNGWVQQVIDGIRAEEALQAVPAKDIVVMPIEYRPENWVQKMPTPAYTDAEGKIRYETHHYWNNAPGFYSRHYSEHLDKSKADGWRA